MVYGYLDFDLVFTFKRRSVVGIVWRSGFCVAGSVFDVYLYGLCRCALVVLAVIDVTSQLDLEMSRQSVRLSQDIRVQVVLIFVVDTDGIHPQSNAPAHASISSSRWPWSLA